MRIRKFAVGLWIFIAITAVSGSAYGWSRAAQNESWVWIAFSFIFVCSITGAVVATNSGYRNVNRETDAGARAANAEERARLLIEGSSDLIFTTLPNLQITSANAAAIAALGDDLNGKNFFDLISFDDISGVGPVLIMGELAELTEKKSKYEKRFRLFGNRGRTPEFVFRMEFLRLPHSEEILIRGTEPGEDPLIHNLDFEELHYSLDSDLFKVETMASRITRNLAGRLDDELVFGASLGLREMLSNAIEHGSLGITYDEKTVAMTEDRYLALIEQRRKAREYAARKINVRYRLSGEAVEYEIEDQGTGFDHQTQLARRPAATESHGRGIHIARNFFDRVEYNDKGNCVKLRKALASRRI
ncbi:MAG TPA: ATP-binding protein [Leptospiraceae bacterium]|nr:ATP-binding protein [Leptospiraceae bacterium]HNN58172.1 ATP-binding protein [Leptospiraceae bacterium]